LFLGIYYNLSIWFKLTDKTHYGTVITVLGAVITIVGNFLLIPVMGFMGSALSALLCYLTMTVVCYWLGQRNYPIPYTVTRDVGYVVFTYSILLLVNRIQINDQWLATSFHAGVILLFLVFVYFAERKNFTESIG
jgi:O-antigen/teichoic acid export membrane protein